MKTLSIIGAMAAIVLTLFLFRNKFGPEAEKPAMDIQEIRGGDGNTQDMITFTDGTTLNDIGFDIEHVGTMVLPASKPVFLFKSFSCRECEPAVNLIIFTSGNGEVNQLPYPGNHTLIGVEDEAADIDDQIVEGVFGKCGGPAHVVLLARKNREVESDGMTSRPGENWSFTFTTVEFSADGKAGIKNEGIDGFTKIQTLPSGDCLRLEPEDSHDYL